MQESQTGSPFIEGATIEAVKGSTTVAGKLWNDCTGPVNVGDSRWSVEELQREGFALAVIEKAAPPRPWLSAEVGETWHLEPFGCNYNVVSAGAPWFTRADAFRGTENIPLNDDRITDAVKLEPVPVTAKKVLDAVIAQTTMHCNACSEHLASIRAEFEVSE